MGKGPKLGLSFLSSIQICRPNHLSTLVNTPMPPPLLATKTFDISLPTLQTPPSSPHHHHHSKPCAKKSSLQTQEASRSRTKREDNQNKHHSHFPSTNHQKETFKNSCSNPSEEEPIDSSLKQRRARTRRFKRYGSKDWTEGSTRKLVNEQPVHRTTNRQVINGSFVVEKRSADPYEDFKKSMLEMIVEREILEPNDLEQLLMSFLSLNSRMHHKAILKAFSDIWNQVFL